MPDPYNYRENEYPSSGSDPARERYEGRGYSGFVPAPDSFSTGRFEPIPGAGRAGKISTDAVDQATGRLPNAGRSSAPGYGGDSIPANAPAAYPAGYDQQAPGAAYYGEGTEPAPQITPQKPEFEPDFGRAFEDYGDYNEPTVEPIAPQVKKRIGFKRFPVPKLLKLAIYLVLLYFLGVFLSNIGWKLADDALGLTRAEEEVEIVINEKDDLDDVTAKLKQAGTIKYEWLFKLYCKIRGNQNFYDPGVYTIKKSYDYNALVNNLMEGAATRETIKLMIAEGSTVDEIIQLLDENNVCSREKLEEAAADYPYSYDFLREAPAGTPSRLEGFLFPDTYEFYLMDDPENALGRFLRNFNNRVDEDYLSEIEQLEMVGGRKLTINDVVTMASIVEAEAATDDDRRKIASVMYNRLNNWEEPYLGMDSTVYYAAKLQGTTFPKDPETLESLYNTYYVTGLPLGPICNPGLNSIRAVLNPADTNYYYFATGKDGVNYFFETAEEHREFIESDMYEDIIPD